jgi:hypothetical protein
MYSSTGHGTTLPMMYPTSGSTAAPFTTQSQSPLSPTYFSTGSAAPYPTGFNQTMQQHAVSPGIMFGNPVGTGMPQVVYSSSPSYVTSSGHMGYSTTIFTSATSSGIGYVAPPPNDPTVPLATVEPYL